MTHIRTSLTKGIPTIASNLIYAYSDQCEARNLKHICFSLSEFPKSVNHQYIHTRFNTRLDPSVHEFRTLMKLAIRQKWEPTGVTAAVILMHSPQWITKENKIRKMDADNKVKPIFDAIEQATGQPDENHWSFHVFKVPSKEKKLTVYLFDLGEVVHYYY